jgi:subtilisin family serine protease
VAIGSVNGKLGRSAFSNYGKKNPKYFFMTPGGEENPPGYVLEDVGAGGSVPCRGTSVATAYAAGLLALLWSDARYLNQTPDVFLANVIQHHRLALPQGNPDAMEYGFGLLRYTKSPEDIKLELTEDLRVLKPVRFAGLFD